ncbi:type II secretion system protein [Chengkuizengella sp. SCS-71B]|uniref:type II secretion system protein n=1 Tax=Chengkuizengella sp. SCS-71B TaxID=3115290 RepID=UPI0032C226CC
MKKIQNMLNKEQGLTLVELLAVIVVLGIIAAIAVPSINGIINDTEVQAREAIALQLYEAARITDTINDPEGNDDDVTLEELIDLEYFANGDLVDPVTALTIGDTTTVDFSTNIITVNDDSDNELFNYDYSSGTLTSVNP